MKYKLEKDSLSSCEVCGEKPANASVNEFYKDGTIKTHHAFLNHVLDIYNKIEIENTKVRAKLVANTSIN